LTRPVGVASVPPVKLNLNLLLTNALLLRSVAVGF
jgi:hypothetical protein